VFAWLRERLAARGLIKGERIGVDASTMEANAAPRSIRRRDTGKSYREMLTRMAEESGVATPSAAELKQSDRERQGKRLSHAQVDEPDRPRGQHHPHAGRPHALGVQPEHAIDLDTEAIVAAGIHPADQGDTTTLDATLEAAARGLDAAGRGPTIDSPAELVTAKGLSQPCRPEGPRRRPVAEPDRRAQAQGDPAARVVISMPSGRPAGAPGDRQPRLRPGPPLPGSASQGALARHQRTNRFPREAVFGALGVLHLWRVHLGPPPCALRLSPSESRMREIRTSGLMSGEGRRSCLRRSPRPSSTLP